MVYVLIFMSPILLCLILFFINYLVYKEWDYELLENAVLMAVAFIAAWFLQKHI
jgi:hypothetical protein